MTVRDTFSDDELAAVKEATRRAEERTSGELVCVVVGRSDPYEVAKWRAAAAGALAGAVLASYWYFAIERWSQTAFLWAALLPLAGAAVAWLLVRLLPSFEREFAGADLMRHRAHQRAVEAFVGEEVFTTRDRTGVLVFLSLLEHRAEILCDEGIRRQVPQQAWSDIVRQLIEGIRAGRAGAALVEAVEACGEILEEHGVGRREDDINELADEARLTDD